MCNPSSAELFRLQEIARSSRKAAAIEKCLLLQCRGASEHRVAVRETAETTDDIGVQIGVAADFLVAGARQLQASLLVGQRFGMHEGQIEELLLQHRAIKAAGNGTVGGIACLGVAGEGTGLATEHIAGKL